MAQLIANDCRIGLLNTFRRKEYNVSYACDVTKDKLKKELLKILLEIYMDDELLFLHALTS